MVETQKETVLFDVEKYKELWSVLDREDRAKLLFICDLPYKQRKAITLMDNSGYSSKEATEILGFVDTRSFERLRAKALQRVLNILNSKKHNMTYSSYMPKKKKKCKKCR